ncbi:MAG TPA: type III pantothenate kinase [Marinagarivorans sp.]
MIIDVDIGNSFAKWRLNGQSHIYRQASASLLDGWQCDLAHADRVRIANVAGEAVLASLLAEVCQRCSVVPEVARVAREMGGVEVCYQDEQRLGVDRWLAMLAAYRRVAGECVVVSAGSALTADWLDASGKHLGGFIAPGRQRMLNALFSDVANVLKTPAAAEQPDLRLGCTTEACVAGGVSVLLQGFINHVASRSLGAPIILTGGDARAMLSVCAQEHKSRVSLVSNAVMDGLAIALP